MSSDKNKSKLQGGEVFDLAGLVEYGEGAIVSRTLVKNDGGSVSVFAFDAGQGLSEHTVPFDALVQVLDGEGEFTIGGKSSEVAEGQIVLMPADVPHAVHANRRFKMLLMMFRKKIKH